MSDLVLNAPPAIQAIAPDKAAGLVPIDDATKSNLNQKAERFVSELLAINHNDPAFSAKASQIASLGQREVAALAAQSNRFLDRPTWAMQSEGSVGNSLTELRKVIEKLDPARGGSLLQPRRLLGVIPFGSKLRPYCDQYKSAQGHIAGLLAALARGRDELLADNIAIDDERKRIWGSLGRLEQMVHLSKVLDTKLESRAYELDATDPTKATAVRESVLFQVRQRTTDLLTQMAVTVQGYLALDLIRKNNVELIKGVDRASTTTIAALRTAVTVAQALASQRLVLDQIYALSTTTARMIEPASELLKRDSAEIQQQAASAVIQVETLQRAFANLYQTMDAVDAFKLQALSSMKQTVNVLASETERAQRYISRAGSTSGTQPSLSIN